MVSKTFLQLAVTSPTDGGFTICMEMYLNGARTGMGITPVAQRVTLSALRTGRPASGAVVPGATRRTMPVPQIEAGSLPAYGGYDFLGFRLSIRPVSKAK